MHSFFLPLVLLFSTMTSLTVADPSVLSVSFTSALLIFPRDMPKEKE